MFGGDEFVRFGQKVTLTSNKYLFKKPISLASYTQSGTVCSSVGHRQLVAMSAKCSSEKAWVIDSLDPNDRFERQGEIVPANEPILLRHCHTN